MTKSQYKKAMVRIVDRIETNGVAKQLKLLSKHAANGDIEKFAEVAAQLDHSMHVSWMLLRRYHLQHQREVEQNARAPQSKAKQRSQ